jgi:hypothetical protein
MGIKIPKNRAEKRVRRHLRVRKPYRVQPSVRVWSCFAH